jgi:membrane protease subunit (stomatin/prohibitin family)
LLASSSTSSTGPTTPATRWSGASNAIGNEIKYGAKLTVREGQAAVFVHEGQLADVFTPGLYMLETNNMPIMTTLQHWDHGFKSPFKSEIYFVNDPLHEPQVGHEEPDHAARPRIRPVRLRAFGSYVLRVPIRALHDRDRRHRR